MPSYKWHLGIGFIAYLAIILFTSYDPLVFLAITVVYSLFPDVDISTSKLGWVIRLLLLLGVILGVLVNQLLVSMILGFLLLTLFFVKHRGFFHTIRASVIFSLPLLFISLPAFAYGVGLYVLHLVLDRHYKF
jgi:hypothetical protein